MVHSLCKEVKIILSVCVCVSVCLRKAVPVALCERNEAAEHAASREGYY